MTTIVLAEADRLLSDLMLLGLGRLRPACRVLAAADGEAAVQFVRQHQPQLVLLDILLPKMNGLAVMRELRADAALRRIPVIVISSLGFRETVEQAARGGARDFILKPFDLGLLLGKVQKALDEASQPAVVG